MPGATPVPQRNRHQPASWSSPKVSISDGVRAPRGQHFLRFFRESSGTPGATSRAASSFAASLGRTLRALGRRRAAPAGLRTLPPELALRSGWVVMVTRHAAGRRSLRRQRATAAARSASRRARAKARRCAACLQPRFPEPELTACFRVSCTLATRSAEENGFLRNDERSWRASQRVDSNSS